MSAYPLIVDWDQLRLDQTTTVAQQGTAEGFRLGLTDLGSEIDQSYQELSQAIADPSSATIDVLSRYADLFGVSISGLTLTEARAIVSGAALANVSDGSEVAVVLTWIAATGATLSGTRVFPLGAGGIWVQSFVDTPPSARYLLRLEAVMAKALGGTELHGVLALPTTGIYDTSRYDDARYGWSIAITPGE